EGLTATIQNILRNEGCESDSTASGEEAIEKATNVDYQMAIIDTGLPGIPGVEVAQRIRKLGDKTNLIVLADDSTFNDCIGLLDYGVEDILIKPVESNELTRVIGEALRSYDRDLHLVK
ncbi:MAG: response regulator, partial [Aigarchaeota archaeon]|nr:response regulator [Aigarchaeota archaeon]